MDITYVKAVFGSLRKTRTQPVYRDDHDLILQLVGVKGLPVHFQAHFSNTEYGTAVVMMGSDGEVSIPNTLLATGLPVYCWILVEQGISGAVRYSVQIPVRQKARPDGTITPEQADIISQAITALNDAGANAQEAADSAAQSAEYVAGVKDDLYDAIDRVGVLEEAKETTLEAAGNAEAWAVGNRDGSAVPSTDTAYHNNSKYYAEQAAESARTLTIDSTLTQAGQAADAKAVGDALTAYDCSGLFLNGYYASSGAIIGTFVENSGYKTCILNVLPKENIRLTGSGATTARLWAFADKNGIITRRANANETLDNSLLVVADNEVYFIYNASTSSNLHIPSLRLIVDRAVSVETLRKDFLSDAKELNYSCFLADGYYTTNGIFIGNFTESASYRTCILNVLPGEEISFTGVGVSTARLWAFADKDKRITRRSAASVTADDERLIVEDGEVYFIYNSSYSTTTHVPSLLVKTNANVSLMDIRARIAFIENSITVARTIKNNLVSDGMQNLPHARAIKNGIVSDDNYGVDGTKYEIDLGNFNKCHVFFRYKHLEYVSYAGVDVRYPIASVGINNAFTLAELYRGVGLNAGMIYRTSFFYPANQNAGNSITLSPQFYNPLNGEDSIYITYTGTINDNTVVSVVFSDSNIKFYVNNNIVGTVNIVGTDTIQDFADNINDIDNFLCEIRNSDGTVSDLLLPESMTVNMIETITRNNVVYYGSLLISIPYKVDNAWHTCEFVVDKTQQVAFASYDGLTRRVNFSEAKALTDGILTIGGNYSQASNISVKDLEIDINHMGDCEILYGKNSSSNTDPVYQLISKHNPRLMIFEGHGITAMSETEAQAAYVESGSDTSEEAMQASIDRLNIIFGKLKERGYTPVSLSEIVSWKKGKMELPKRCYACIFDDYRIENYIDYKKRIPFATYGVKAGLAIISDMKLLTDEVVINDKTYTVKDALQMIELAGWYPCSHTKNHRYINNYTVQENRNLFKEDVLSADDHFVYSNVIVYPYGAVNVKTRPAFSESGFQLGITIVADRYNCKGTANYLLSRTELGTRASINSVLEPFI